MFKARRANSTFMRLAEPPAPPWLLDSIIPFRLLGSIIPLQLQNNPVALSRAENLLSALFLGVTILPCYAFFYVIFGDSINALMCLLAMIGPISAIFILRKSANIVLAREAIVISLFGLLLALTYRLGGINAPTVIWITLCPLIAMTAGGLRPGLIWSILALVAVSGIYIADIFSLLVLISAVDRRLLAAVSSIGFVFTVAVHLVLAERNSAKALAKLDMAMNTIYDLAIRDELTGIYNRRHLMNVINEVRSKASIQELPFCVCLIDIDHFKRINDTHGHAAGDEILRQLAASIQAQIRNGDCFGRFGGEEFLVLLPDTTAETAMTFIERIRQSVEAAAFIPEHGDEKITISVGIAEYVKSEAVEMTISRADGALYAAKEHGRNRVVRSDLKAA